ncbi:unnamed protein product [Larinioides sclopetarius]|uniref:NADH dehydrogenase subunit 1 n=1 Tax=Larinioides sclopetarius TaxID=280406 RepID=A0AAV2BR92_9ARAC
MCIFEFIQMRSPILALCVIKLFLSKVV